MKLPLLLFYTISMNHFLIWLWCVTKRGFYVTTSENHLSGWTKKKLQSTSQSQTRTIKGPGHCLVVCCWSDTAFWILAKPLHLRIMLSKSMKLQCLKPALLNRKNPNSSPWQHSTTHDTTTASKAEWIALRSSASFSTFSWPLANWLPLLQASQQLFAGKMFPPPAGGRKCFPRVCQTQRHRFSHYGNKPTYFSLAKCVDCNGCYFD